MILTKEFLRACTACTEGYRAVLENNLVDQDYEAAISFFKSSSNTEFNSYADWLQEQKTTELYVRTNGTVITMLEKYKAFNPVTGVHTDYETEADAKQALLNIAQSIIDSQNLNLIQANIYELPFKKHNFPFVYSLLYIFIVKYKKKSIF